MNRVWLFVLLVFGVLLVAPVQAASPLGDSVVPKKGAFLGAKPTLYPDWFKESFLELEGDVEEAAEGGKRLLILFHQDGCPYCNVLVERNLSQKHIETSLRDNFDVVAINMWGDREVLDTDGRSFTEKQFAAAMKVQFTPTMLFLDESGKTVLRLNGYLPPVRFKAALDFVAAGEYRKTSFRDYFAKLTGTGSGSKEMIAEAFFRTEPVDLRKLGDAPGIALFFEQGDCPPCEDLHAGPLQDSQTRDAANRLHSVQLDMWSNQPVITTDGRQITARELARELDVKYAPSIVLLDSAGEEIIRNEAEFKTFHTLGILEYARSGAYRGQASFQRWLEARADHLREQGIDVDLWK